MGQARPQPQHQGGIGMRIPAQLIVLDAVGTLLAGVGVAGLITDLSGLLPFMANQDSPARRRGRLRAHDLRRVEDRAASARATTATAGAAVKITALETIRLPGRPNLLLAQVHTDEGLVGLGETSRGALAVEAQMHDLVAPYLLGKDPLAIQLHSKHLMASYLGFASSERGDPRRLRDRHGAVGHLRPGHAASRSISCWAAPVATASAPTTPARATTTTRAPWPAGRSARTTGPKARTTIRSPSPIAPTNWRRACCPKASPR